MQRDRPAAPGILVVLCGLFLVSGAAGLVLETVLLRQLTWLFGSSALATSLVLAAFMGGLASGAALFGRLVDRSPHPLRIYGLLELGVGGLGALLVWLLGSGREWFLTPLRALDPGATRWTVELIFAFALLLLPTMLMGGTLPAVSRFVIRESERLAGSLGLLYGLNTLGASAGVFLAGFYLIEWLGVSAAAYAAAGVNMLAGCAALILDRLAAPTRLDLSRDEATQSGTVHSDAGGGPTVRALCLTAAGIGGAAVLGYEVLWTRLLSLPMRSFSYSFSLMLSLFLLGLVLGALLLRLVERRIGDPVALLGWIQVAMGVYVALSIVWLPELLTPGSATSFGAFLARAALRASLVVLPPTILSGMALPLAVRGFSGGLTRVGRDVGAVFAVNTAGGIAGALIAGLLLLPSLGAPLSLVLLATFNATAGLLIFAAVRGPRWRTAVAAVLVLACGLASTAGGGRFVRAFLEASRGSEKIGELLFFHEGAADTIAIVRKDYGFHDPEAKSLITNGVAMAATVKPVWRYMAAEGHLPLLFASRPQTAMHVGVGTGITLGAVVSHPGLRSITAAELSAGVIEGLPFFEQENGAAYLDPRVRLVREDGRHFLELTSQRFDVITIEPPPPIVAGSVHLYSLDFYDLCRRRLNRRGVVAQWLPLHAQSLVSARMTARTFLDAFPHVQLWLPSVRDAVLIGSEQPLRMEIDDVLQAFADPSVDANLRRAYLESPEALLSTFLWDRDGVERWSMGAPPITDEHPGMEFFRNQGGNMTDRDIATLLAIPQGEWGWLAGLESRPGLAERLVSESRALRFYVESTVRGDARAGLAAARLSSATEFFLYRLGCAREQLDRLPPEAAGQLDRCRALPHSGL